MLHNVKTKTDFSLLSNEDQEKFKTILAGACIKQKEENNQIVDYYDFSALKPFGFLESDLTLPALKKVDIDLGAKPKEAKEKKISDIDKLCDISIASGFTSEALGSKHFYYSTIEEQSTLNSLINLGVDNHFKAQKIVLLEGKEVKESRVVHFHTIEQLRKVLIDGFTHISSQVAKKDILEEQINNSTSIEQIESISWEV